MKSALSSDTVMTYFDPNRNTEIIVTIHSTHDKIRIAILASRYDTYRDTLFRLEIISNCMRIILWSSTMVFTILQSLFEMVLSHMFNIFVKVL